MSEMRSALSNTASASRQRRVHKLDTRWDDVEHAQLLAKAQAAGLSPNAYLRTLVVGSPGPRAQRAPTVNAEALAHATAALNKVGGNLNQLVRLYHSGGGRLTAQELFAVLQDVRTAVSRILEIVGRRERR